MGDSTVLDSLFNEIDAAVRGGAWTLALAGVLAIPDICSALQSPNGESTGRKYKNWVRDWLGKKYPELDPEEIYQMRCSALHQGTTSGATYSRVIFVAPGPNFFHNNVLNDALNLDLPTFCRDMKEGVVEWEKTVCQSVPFTRNSISLMRWYPNGLSPYFSGVPVFT